MKPRPDPGGAEGPTASGEQVPDAAAGGMSASDAGLMVTASDDTTGGVADLDHWCELVRRTLRLEGVVEGGLDLFFVDSDTMTELNREHMGQDRPTDVLAFPLDGPESDGPAAAGFAVATAMPDGAAGPPPRHLGDVVVCPEVARRQAPEHCGAYEPEMTLLIVHGVLHVLGHDHAELEETLVMQDRERDHLERSGYRHPVGSR